MAGCARVGGARRLTFPPGKFVKAAIKNFPSFAGKRIYAATDYYSPQRIVSELAAVCGGSDAAASAAV